MNFNLQSKGVYDRITGLNLSGFLKSKPIFIMKLVAVLLTVLCLQVSAEGFSQKITISRSNASLKSVLQEIRKQSGYELLYSSDLLQKAAPVSIQIRNSKLEDALNQTLKGQNFGYEIIEKTILIKPLNQPVKNTASSAAVIRLKTVSGRVVTEDQQPLPGVIITEKGSSNKTATDSEGQFELKNAADDAIIIASYIGYETEEISTKGLNKALTISLKPSNTKLQEVAITVSTGYQNLPKERATGSFSFVDKKKLAITNLASTNFAKGLEGMVPGLLVGPNGEMQVRGVSSIKTGTRQVLIVVDGFPVESGNMTINPNDIENITVLKDAAAASIWGVRASNGVIVITTKSGIASDGKAIFDFSTSLSIDQAPDFSTQRIASTADYVDFEVETIKKGWFNPATADNTGYSKVAELFYKKSKGLMNDAQVQEGIDNLKKLNSLDQQDLIYRKAVQRQINLSVRGGTEKHKFAISSFYTNQLAANVGSKNDQFILNVKNSLQVLPKLTLSLGLNTTYANKTGNRTGYDFATARPYLTFLDENGGYVSHGSKIADHLKQGYYDKGYKNWDTNPLQNIENTNTKANTFASRINVGADYKVIKGVNITSQFQTELLSNHTDNLQNLNTYYVRNLANTWRVLDPVKNTYVNKFPVGPVYDKLKERQNSWTFRNMVNVDHQIGTDHSITGIAGMELRKIDRKSNTERYYNYNPQALTVDYFDAAAIAATTMNSTGGYESYTWNPLFAENDNRFFSLFANAAYTYKNKYTISGSIRTDQSNLFGTDPQYRYRPLWSTGLSWNATNEAFLQSATFLNKLILRATYGINGNIGNSSPYPIAGTGKNFNTQENMLTFNNPENQALRPEKTASTNFGIDFGVLNNRITGSLDLYRKKSYDLLGNSILDPTTGFEKAEMNTATMTNRGIELNLNARILQGELRVNADFTFGYNKNRVTNVLAPSNTASTYAAGLSPVKGLPLSYLYSYQWAGLSDKGEPQIYDANGNVRSWSATRITDVNALKYVGTMDPPVYGGLMVNIAYKNFILTPQFTYKFGHVMRINTTRTDLNAGLTNDISQRWQNPGDELHTNIPRIYNSSTIDARWNDYYKKADLWDDDASFIRLRSLSLSYQLPQKFLHKVFTAASITGQANNLWLWTANKQNLDPDYTNLSTGSIGYPAVKNYVISLNLNF